MPRGAEPCKLLEGCEEELSCLLHIALSSENYAPEGLNGLKPADFERLPVNLQDGASLLMSFRAHNSEQLHATAKSSAPKLEDALEFTVFAPSLELASQVPAHGNRHRRV